jgi:hypothetical protein
MAFRLIVVVAKERKITVSQYDTQTPIEVFFIYILEIILFTQPTDSSRVFTLFCVRLLNLIITTRLYFFLRSRFSRLL